MRDNEKRRAKWNRIEGLANVAYDQEARNLSAELIEMEIEFIYYARLECVSKLDGRR